MLCPMQAKARTERKLSFPDFLVGINLIAACKWPNTDESVARRLVTDRICTAAAKLGSHTTKVESDGICEYLYSGSRCIRSMPPFTSLTTTACVCVPRWLAVSKLTDSRLYTGAHKHRFDEEGHGKGIAGRDSVSKGAGGGAGKYHGGAVSDLSQITRSNLVGGGTTTMKVSRVITAGPTGTTRGTTSSHGK